MLWAQTGTEPTAQAVQEEALVQRWAMWEQAVEAIAALGDPASLISQAEGDLRAICHDALVAHHDKDYRSLATLPVPLLRDVHLHVWLVDYWGRKREALVIGAQCSDQ